MSTAIEFLNSRGLAAIWYKCTSKINTYTLIISIIHSFECGFQIFKKKQQNLGNYLCEHKTVNISCNLPF